MQLLVTRLENICSEMQNAFFTPLKMNISVSFHAKPCILEFPSSPTTVEGQESQLGKDVDICAKPKRTG
jgi:hypothetical protein